MSGCAAAVEALLEQGVGAWSGLPAGCHRGAIPIADLDPSPGMADLGLRKAFFRFGALAGTPVQLWTTTDEQEVLMLAVESPLFVATGGAALEHLGAPERRLDSALGTVQLQCSEWVYAERGLAVFVDPDTDRVWRATLFRTCTPEEYEAEFRVDLLERRLPRARY
jgi:hypothetical protein